MLDKSLSEAASRGLITHASVAFYGGTWHATVANTHQSGSFHSGAHDDPVIALEAALEAAVKGVRKPKVTAAVIIPPGAGEGPPPETFENFLLQASK